MRAEPTGSVVLRVDPVACEGVGLCAHLAGRLVATDPWGFPIVFSGVVPAQELRRVEAAVSACPHRALWLEPASR
jgi:ferredoxin